MSPTLGERRKQKRVRTLTTNPNEDFSIQTLPMK